MEWLYALFICSQSNCRSIEQLSQKAISETTSHLYNETLPFPSLTFCPGLKNTASLHENNGIDTVSKTFVEAEQKLRNLSSLVVDVGHVLPNRWYCCNKIVFYPFSHCHNTHRVVTWKEDFNDSSIFQSKIVPLLYMGTTRCFTYNAPEPSKVRWGGEVKIVMSI